MIPTALSIAGSDSSGGAGIQGDLKTFQALGVYGMSVITAVTAQNTQGVSLVEPVSPELVEEQISMVCRDIPPDAVKTGMLYNAETVEIVAATISSLEIEKLIIDPVMVSSSGRELLDREGVSVLKTRLIPRAALVTPNLDEAEILAGMRVDSIETMKKAAREIMKLGAGGVLVTGGHLEHEAVDILFSEDEFQEFSSAKLQSDTTHGTGCSYSAAITAHMARGLSLPEAVRSSKEFVYHAIKNGLKIGRGNGPLNHFSEVFG